MFGKHADGVLFGTVISAAIIGKKHKLIFTQHGLRLHIILIDIIRVNMKDVHQFDQDGILRAGDFCLIITDGAFCDSDGGSELFLLHVAGKPGLFQALSD